MAVAVGYILIQRTHEGGDGKTNNFCLRLGLRMHYMSQTTVVKCKLLWLRGKLVRVHIPFHEKQDEEENDLKLWLTG